MAKITDQLPVPVILLIALWLSLMCPSPAPAQTLPLSVAPVAGQGGEKATERLRSLLQRVGPFQLQAAAPGAPTASGNLGDGGLEGQLTAGDGRVLFKRKYGRGSLEADLRQFTDDIVLTLTKRPGIATSQIAFAFSQGGKPFQIFACDFDGGNLRQLTESAGSHVAPAFSPDGSLLANVLLQQGDLGLIQVVDLAKGRPMSIKSDPALRVRMAFSPDGKQIALSKGENGGANHDLFLVKPPRGKPEPLTRTSVPEMSPSWAPDGKRLVFAAVPAPGRSDLFVMDLRKKSSSPLPTGKAVSTDPAWSPDGRLIAFVSVVGDRRTLCLRDLQSGQTRELTAGSQPVWGADSRHLLFIAPGGGLSMMAVDRGNISHVVVGGGRVVDPTWTR